jgi:hypothetical protein
MNDHHSHHRRVRLVDLTRDQELQPRAGFDEDLLEALRDAVTRGETLPPVVAFHDGENLLLADGFHRYHVYSSLDLAEIECTIYNGIRGASALVDAGRINRTAGGMSEEIAKMFGLEPKDATRFVGLYDVKANMAPRGDMMWFELRSMPLGNTSVNRSYPAGDHVHAAVPWEPPATFDGLSLAVIKEIFDAISAGPELNEFYHPTRQANDWVGSLIVKHGKSADNAAEIVKIWLHNGVLEQGEYQSPKRRKMSAKVTLVKAKAAEILAPLHTVVPEDQ